MPPAILKTMPPEDRIRFHREVDLSWCRQPMDAPTPAGMFHVLVRQWFEEQPEELWKWLRAKLSIRVEDPDYGFDLWCPEHQKTYRVTQRPPVRWVHPRSAARLKVAT